MKKIFLLLILAVCTLQARARCVSIYVKNPKITQYQYDAFVHFTYNVGCKAFRNSTMLRKFNAGDITGASAEFPKWIYVGHKPNRGLVKRRIDERNMFDGKYGVVSK